MLLPLPLLPVVALEALNVDGIVVLLLSRMDLELLKLVNGPFGVANVALEFQ
jgi:hypothetical protein